MKAIALLNRLCRDLDVGSVHDLTSDIRQEILDAINGALQILHDHAPSHAKTTRGGIMLPAPSFLTLTVMKGSEVISGHLFSDEDLYRTIRLAGDDIDNQVTGSDSLLHPYGGESGTVGATLYGDAVSLPEDYEEVVSDGFLILETRRAVVREEGKEHWVCRTAAGCPSIYRIEANAMDRNPPAPAVLRFRPLPDRMLRLEGDFLMAPARMVFSDLVTPGADVPLRADQIESYLLPVARGILSSCRLWKNKEEKSLAVRAGERAEESYKANVVARLGTPRNRVGTKRGF